MRKSKAYKIGLPKISSSEISSQEISSSGISSSEVSSSVITFYKTSHFLKSIRNCLLSLSLNNYRVLIIIIITIDNCAIITIMDYFLLWFWDEKIRTMFLMPHPPIHLISYPHITKLYWHLKDCLITFWQKNKNSPWNKLELFCKAPVGSFTGRTEIIP